MEHTAGDYFLYIGTLRPNCWANFRSGRLPKSRSSIAVHSLPAMDQILTRNRVAVQVQPWGLPNEASTCDSASTAGTVLATSVIVFLSNRNVMIGLMDLILQCRKWVTNVSAGRSIPAKTDKSGKTCKSLDSCGHGAVPPNPALPGPCDSNKTSRAHLGSFGRPNHKCRGHGRAHPVPPCPATVANHNPMPPAPSRLAWR